MGSHLLVMEDNKYEELDFRSGKASAEMRALHYSVVLKRDELSRKAKLSVFKSIFVPILTYGQSVQSQMKLPK